MRPRAKKVWLDYAAASRKAKSLPNLSAIATAHEFLWTASDEMRTIECLAPDRDGYRLHTQVSLDEAFPGLPGGEAGHEADIEALEVADGRLWVCGSHSLTRRPQQKSASRIDPVIHKRPSRRLLGALPLAHDGSGVTGAGHALPFNEEGSLRAVLGARPHIAPFMELPSKENGLDIEGLTIFRKRLYVGLRGPVVDNTAIIAELRVTAQFTVVETSVVLHFIDLDGLGVRDLARSKDGIIIVAGPVSGADGPFTLLRWRPRRTANIQVPELIMHFKPRVDHPEGICALRRGNVDGLLVVYDTKNLRRISGTRYCADWIKL
jgi:Protein of unknown function (DUF3616)